MYASNAKHVVDFKNVLYLCDNTSLHSCRDAHSCLQTMVRGYGLQKTYVELVGRLLSAIVEGKVATIELQNLFLLTFSCSHTHTGI